LEQNIDEEILWLRELSALYCCPRTLAPGNKVVSVQLIAAIPIAAVTNKGVNKALTLSRLEQNSVSNAIYYVR